MSKDCANKDYCIPEDDRAGPDGVYVSLPDNPERYTGYAGAHANNIWKAVYQENCFNYTGESGNVLDPKDQCIEQRLFYRLLSGMHSSVSTHLCYDYLNTTTGAWGPNVDCFMSRVGNHPERLSNLYFNYALVSRAVAKLRNYIDDLQFCPEASGYDQATRQQVLHLAQSVNTAPHIFNETLVFSTPEGLLLKEEFRNRFRKVSTLMDCVGCDRCRLWGKLQAAGYGTALKIVFELSENSVDDIHSKELMASLRRSELVSLINTFDRLSKSVEAIEYFRNEVRADLENTLGLEKRFSRSNQNASKQASTRTMWDGEWISVYNALKFVVNSYVEFPKNMWYLFLERAIVGWTSFTGSEATKNKQWATVNKMDHINVDL